MFLVLIDFWPWSSDLELANLDIAVTVQCRLHTWESDHAYRHACVLLYLTSDLGPENLNLSFQTAVITM